MASLLKTRAIQLDDSDIASAPNTITTELSNTDYKQDRKLLKIRQKVLDYFEKYPTFKNAILTNDHIQKICTVVERHVFKKGCDKKVLVLLSLSAVSAVSDRYH